MAIIQGLLQRFVAWAETIQGNYSVNPYIFIIIVAICFPFFYFSLYRLVKSIAKRQSQQAGVWGSVFLLATVGPYFYVLIFGRNLPWWVYLIIGVLFIQGIISLVRKFRKKPADTN